MSKQNKNNRKNLSDEQRSYRRDTVGAILVLFLLICAPIAITVHEQKQAKAEAAQMEAINAELESMMASPSEALPPEASEAAEQEPSETAAPAGEAADTSKSEELLPE